MTNDVNFYLETKQVGVHVFYISNNEMVGEERTENRGTGHKVTFTPILLGAKLYVLKK